MTQCPLEPVVVSRGLSISAEPWSSESDDDDDNDIMITHLGVLLALGQAGCLQEHISSAEGVRLIVIMPRPPNPECVISLARSPSETCVMMS